MVYRHKTCGRSNLRGNTILQQQCLFFLFKHRFHKRARNLLQAFSKCLHEVYFFLKRYSHVNDISTLEMHTRWFEKEFSNMRFAIGWGNSQTGDGLILDRKTLNMRGSWYAMLQDEGILSMRYFAIGWGNFQT
jgi:hypothetical protein